MKSDGAVNVRIGGREILKLVTLIVPGGDDAWLELKLHDWSLKIRFVFLPVGGESATSGYSFVPKDGYAEIQLTGWSSPLSVATKQPVPLAHKSDGRKIQVMLWGTAAGDTRRLDVQFSVDAGSQAHDAKSGDEATDTRAIVANPIEEKPEGQS